MSLKSGRCATCLCQPIHGLTHEPLRYHSRPSAAGVIAASFSRSAEGKTGECGTATRDGRWWLEGVEARQHRPHELGWRDGMGMRGREEGVCDGRGDNCVAAAPFPRSQSRDRGFTLPLAPLPRLPANVINAAEELWIA
jgi:hypothetical protein